MGNEDGSVLNCSQIMPFHIRGTRKHFNEYLSKEQKCKRSACPLLSDDTFQPGISPSGARGCQSSVHFAVKKKRNRERESYAEVLSTRLWSAALKLGQWHLTSLTKNKSFFFFLETVERKEYRKRKVFPIEYEPECEQFRAFYSSSIG